MTENRLPPEDRLPDPKVYLNPAPRTLKRYEVGEQAEESFTVEVEVPAWLQGDLDVAIRVDTITLDGVPCTWNAFSLPFVVKRGPYVIHMPAFALLGAVGKTEADVRDAINTAIVNTWLSVVQALMENVSSPETNPDPDPTPLYVTAEIEENKVVLSRTEPPPRNAFDPGVN
jgi:hypothetical protein